MTTAKTQLLRQCKMESPVPKDALQNQATMTYNTAGQVTPIANIAGTSQFGYTNGFRTSVTDPLNRTTASMVDAAGRLVGVADPAGNLTQYAYDRLTN